MPFAKFKSVREVSSEDINYPAENLKSTAKKWKTKAIGERVAYVVLELSEPYMITGIDIGNEFSAFIEVLVGKTSNTNNFTEILVTCSFMTPIESKNSTNTNRVRCFNKEALVSTAVSEKWQFVKLICTQPFNKHIQYGISFIKIHVAESENENTKKVVINLKDSPSLNFSQLGKFKLREDSPESESESSAALFKRWKTSQWSDKNTLKVVESPSKAENFAHLTNAKTDAKNVLENVNVSVKQKSLDILDRNSEELAFRNDVTSESQNVNRKRRTFMETIEQEREQLGFKSENPEARNEHKKKKVSSSVNFESKSSTKKCIGENTSITVKKLSNVKANIYRPFNQLLKGTILVISGIQNPERSDIRDKALAMGAKYRADWETDCTHLICAFKNTPKYNQVNGKGKIVTRAWIEDCHRQKKKIPWRRYALDSSDLNQLESEEEILDESLRPVRLTVTNDISQHSNLSMSCLNSNDKSFTVTSGSDTDDEIQKVLQNNIAVKDKPTAKSTKKSNPFDATTEEEEFLTKKTELSTSQRKRKVEIFKGTFFICDDIRSTERKKIENILQINEGAIINEAKAANYLISNRQMTGALGATKGILVKPDWIYECNDMEMEVPIKQYLL